MTVTRFENDDAGCREWIELHSSGFVVNRFQGETNDFTILHCAECHCVMTSAAGAALNSLVKRIRTKICADTVADLRAWSRVGGDRSGGFSLECPQCRPWKQAGYSDINSVDLFRRILRAERARIVKRHIKVV